MKPSDTNVDEPSAASGSAVDLFIACVRRISQACGILAVVLIALSVLVVCHLVFVRYALRESAIWQHEFVTFGLIAATLVGSPYVLLTRGHVNVDLLPQALGQRGRFALAVVASLFALFFCAVLTVTGVRFWYDAYEGGWTASTVWAPRLWIPYLALPVGMGLMCLQYVADLLALFTGRAPPFGLPPKEPEA